MLALVNGNQNGRVIQTDGWDRPVDIGGSVQFFGGQTAKIVDAMEGPNGSAVLMLDRDVTVPDNAGIWNV